MNQDKIACFFAILFVLLISQSISAQEQGSKKNSSEKSNSGLVYQCDKDPGVMANNPGNCNKCGAELKARTMDEAMAKLSGKSKNKPELKVRSVYSVKKENTETHESMEVAEKTEKSVKEDTVNSRESGVEEQAETSDKINSEEHDANVLRSDLNKDGYVYQCPKCYDQLSDVLKDCEECFRLMDRVTVEQAKKNVPVYER